MARKYGKLPSQIVGIEETYTAFCLDEACAYIETQLEQGKEPRWIDKEEEEKKDGLAYLLELQHRL